jgi:hypothetical protein
MLPSPLLELDERVRPERERAAVDDPAWVGRHADIVLARGIRRDPGQPHPRVHVQLGIGWGPGPLLVAVYAPADAISRCLAALAVVFDREQDTLSEAFGESGIDDDTPITAVLPTITPQSNTANPCLPDYGNNAAYAAYACGRRLAFRPRAARLSTGCDGYRRGD